MSLIDIKNLSFAYDGSAEKVFDNVSFQIDTGWRLGFTGRNGRGKTTFLKLLMGELEYTGSISASVSFDYFPIALHDTARPAAEALAEVVSDGEEWRLRREMAMLGLDEALLDRPFDSLSGGERTKLQLAAMFTNEDDFLLIDEPTNHLDEAGRERVARYLRRKRGFILVSHDRAFLDGCVDHILSINRADIEVTQGYFSTWLENKERRDRYELAENDRLKKEIGRLEAAAREKAQWADKAERAKIGFDPTRTEKSMGRRAYEGAKSKKSMKRAKAIDRRIQGSIEQKSELLKNLETADDLKLSPLRHYSERLLELRELEIDYGAGAIAQPLSFELRQGQRIALRGVNGCGKSSVLKLISGENIPHTGEIWRAGGLKISYIPQDSSFLRGDLRSFARERGIDESRFKTILRKLDMTRGHFDRDMAGFSAGQRKKVLIAASLCEQAHVYVWDEPLNYIDLLSRMQIEELLLNTESTMIFVEHDRAFCDHVATDSIYM